jgi:hypothetical protein
MSSTNKIKELQERIRELERAVGQKQMKVDFLEKLIEIADGELGIDIKKKAGSPPRSGSGGTEKRSI